MPQIYLQTGEVFFGRADISILEAAREANIVLDSSCRSGRCSACKCKILEGSTKAIHRELGLSEDQKKDGWILACARTATSDIVISSAPVVMTDLPPPKTFACKINDLIKISENLIIVELRLPPSLIFDFLPGQHLILRGPSGAARSYSIAKVRWIESQAYIQLHIRGVRNGVLSEYWFYQAKVNDLLRFYGPLGTFFLREVSNKDIVFLATGTGMAPIAAMLDSLATASRERLPNSVSLFWGVRRPGDFYLDISDIRLSFPFRFVPVVSRFESCWDGVTGYVQDALFEAAPDWGNLDVYACGSHSMIKDAEAKLLASGLRSVNFYSDSFVESGPTNTKSES